MAKIRKRTLPSGAVRYLVDYRDQAGKRRFKQFKKRKIAEGWMTTALFEVQQGTHTPAAATVELLVSPLKHAQPEEKWHEDRGPVLWWNFPIEEAPHIDSPLDCDWPGGYSHWTPIVCPEREATRAARR